MILTNAYRPDSPAALPSMMSPVPKRLRFIDIGANLLDAMYQGEYNATKYHEADQGRVLERAWAAGVEKIIITAGSLKESRAALELAASDPRLFCTVGVHPTRVGEFTEATTPEAHLDELRKVLADGRAAGKVVAVGECGLDYDRVQFCDAETQRKFFRLQFALAKESGLPMFLHMRAAAADFSKILSEHVPSFAGGGVVHSFDGTAAEAENLLKQHPALMFGINGCSLKTELNCDIMAAIPLERLMIETDAPWCDVRPTHAGAQHVRTKLEAKDKKKYAADCLVKGRNEPCNIVQVLEIVAAKREISNTWALAETIYHNTDKFFFGRAAGV